MIATADKKLAGLIEYIRSIQFQSLPAAEARREVNVSAHRNGIDMAGLSADDILNAAGWVLTKQYRKLVFVRRVGN